MPELRKFQDLETARQQEIAQEVRKKLNEAKTGEEREQILYAKSELFEGTNRDAVKSNGAFIVLTSGEATRHGNCWEEKLSRVMVGVLDRAPVGKGHTGGREEPQDGGDPRESATRELYEELRDLRVEITAPKVMHRLLEGPVPDDAYIKRTQNVTDNVTAVDAYAFHAKVEPELFEEISRKQNQNVAEGSEARGYKAEQIFKALKFGYGKERDAYTYAHEYFADWAVAVQEVKSVTNGWFENPDKLAECVADLAAEVQTSICRGPKTDFHKIDFNEIAKAMRTDLKGLDERLGLKEGTVSQMQQAVDKAVTQQKGRGAA